MNKHDEALPFYLNLRSDKMSSNIGMYVSTFNNIADQLITEDAHAWLSCSKAIGNCNMLHTNVKDTGHEFEKAFREYIIAPFTPEML